MKRYLPIVVWMLLMSASYGQVSAEKEPEGPPDEGHQTPGSPIGPGPCKKTDYYPDMDGDGYGDSYAIGEIICEGDAPPVYLTPDGPRPYRTNRSDCNDKDASINPNTIWYLDMDGDGYASSTKKQCVSPGSKYSVVAIPTGDCDDNNPSLKKGYLYYADMDGDTFGSMYGKMYSCNNTPPQGYVTNNKDYDDNNPGITDLPPLNTNCSNQASYIAYEDRDGDGYGAGLGRYTCGSLPEGYSDSYGDCDDSNPNIGIVIWYRDADGDGYGSSSNPKKITDNGSSVTTHTDCATPPNGYVSNKNDCDDNHKEINPNTVWYLDADGDGFAISTKKQCSSPGTGYNTTVKPLGDCDDNNASLNPNTVWYLDADSDGFAVSTKKQCSSPGAGYSTTTKPLGDCDDGNSSINPNTKWYADTDGDGYGDPNNSKKECSQPSSYVKNNQDKCPTIYSKNSNGCPYQAIALSNENYIYTRTYQTPMTSDKDIDQDSDVVEQVTYFDGLGRPMQQVAIKASHTDQKDIVTHIGYDAYGRQDKDWLPYHDAGTVGAYRSGDVKTSTQNYYKANYGDDFTGVATANTNPYSQKEFEASPLNRVLKQAAPGKDWKLGSGHEITFNYDANAGNEVKLFTATTTEKIFTGSNGKKTITYPPTLTISTKNSGYYAAGELYKTVTYDENHTSGKSHSTEEFKDKEGRVVLKRTYGTSDLNEDGDTLDAGEQEAVHDTYYVYDYYGNLTYVLPPKINATTASMSTITSSLDALGYQYVYDGRNRLVEKKLPGKGREYMVYNKLDQPIMTQDAIQHQHNEWLFTLYDAFGRVAYTGKDTNNTNSREELQVLANAHTKQFVTQTTTSTNYAGTPVYYTKDAFPNHFDQVLTINYYDTYVDTDGLSVPSSVYGVSKAPSTKGLATVSKTRVLGTDQWITAITGYDKKGRVIYSAEQNDYLNTTTIVQNDLDFIGKVNKNKTQHRKDAGTWVTTIDHYSYDHRGRLVDHYQCIGEESSFNGCDNTADYTSKTYSSPLNTTTIQTASESFILKPGFHFVGANGKTLHLSIAQKGELIAHNSYDNLGQLQVKSVGNTKTKPLQTVRYVYNVRGWLKKINNPSGLGNSLFGFEIKYNDIADPAKKLFNGNISQTLWDTQSVNSTANDVSTQYTYSYDALNRILSATDNTGHYNVSGITYDKNGNITKLSRNGFQGNTSFTGMDVLSYNYGSTPTNQLQGVTDGGNTNYGFTGSHSGTDYTYDANGNLLSDANKGIASIQYNHLNLPTKVTTSQGNILYIYDASGIKLKKKVTEESSLTETDYAGNYIYENGQLQFFNHPEGYVDTQGSGYKYVYQYKDHLGNIRLSYQDADGNGNIAVNEIIEERNYYPFGLEHKGYNNVVNGTENNYQTFQGKEYQKELDLNWHDFHARQYMADIGRTTTLDPLAENFYSFSPYSFLNNSPLNFIDPTGMSAEDIIEIEKSTGKISITEAEGDDVVRLVNNGNVEAQYNYGENGSFSNDNKIIQSTLKDGKTEATVLVTSEIAKAEKFYRFAAQSDVEFSKIDVTVKGVDASAVSTAHKSGSEPTSRELVAEFSKRGFIGVKQSHSHPGNSAGSQVPSGYYGIQKGNPNSLTVFDRTYGDAGNANAVRKFPGFKKTIFEVYSPFNKTTTTYDGINKAKINTGN